MLTELYCDKFKSTAPNPIKFNPGLNIVLGTHNASNSIGKSTFLMLIDFAFGGTDYLTLSKDVVANIGPHTVMFAFEFDGITYRFARPTDHKQTVYRLNDDGEVIETILLTDYRNFLLQKYGLESTGLSWRDCVSGSFRIWQRDNDKPSLPLSTYRSDTHQNGIRRLLGLFEQFDEIGGDLSLEASLRENVEAAKHALNAYEFSIAKNKEEFNNNLEEIQRLEQSLEELRATLEMNDVNQLNTAQADSVAQLKRLMIPLKRRRTILENQKTSLKNMGMYKDKHRRSADFSDLIKFFPEINIERLEKVETFHAGLKKVMKKEIAKTQSEIDAELERVNRELDKLSSSVAQITQINPDNISLKAATALSEITNKLNALKQANQGYVLKTQYSAQLRELRDTLDAAAAEVLPKIQNQINEYLKEVDGSFTKEKRNPPEIKLEKIDKYSYAIADDTGTGSGYRSLLSFDLALLEKSALPVIIEDSMLFKQIETTAVNRILKRYQGITKKQIFIALDEVEKYDEATRMIIEEDTVLHLDEGAEALFGREWAKRK